MGNLLTSTRLGLPQLELLNRSEYSAGTLSTRIESWRSLRENLGKYENFDEVITWIENGFNVEKCFQMFRE
jgi:hypothetical protein